MKTHPLYFPALPFEILTCSIRTQRMAVCFEAIVPTSGTGRTRRIGTDGRVGTDC